MAIVAADLLITRIREGIIKILVNVVASVGIIMIMAMANAVWVFWDLLLLYSWEDRVTKLTLDPR